ncbi:MAG TPA: prenyltransferase/squalene oxidase repeat-containing protein [Planctomycetota bacterium]|nr:prenyltransferase/squalene oxidase repeat-containing protein [Planctomycetota bacterium]
MIGSTTPILLTLLAATQSAPLTFRSDEYGFRFERPSDAWACHTADGGKEALFTVSAYPRSSAGLPNLVVYVAKLEPAAGPEAVRDAVAKKLEPTARNITKAISTVAGEKAFVLTAEPSYRLRVAYLARPPFLYALQASWTPGDGEQEETLRGMEASFALFPARAAETGTPEAKLRRLADRCGSQIEWAPTWSAAAERAKREKKLVFVHYEQRSVLDIPHTFSSGPIADPAFAACLRERFVALKMGPGDPAPFRDPAVYGVSEHSWGSAVLVATPDGRVLRDTSIGDADFLRETAESAWEEVYGKRPASRPAKGPLEDALARMREGHLEDAERRFRARASDPQALFWCGAIAWLRGGVEAARPDWQKLVDDHEESPWAWKAAANLLGRGALVNGGEVLVAPSKELRDAARFELAPPGASIDAARAEREAVAYLLRTQLDDGSWPTPVEDFSLTRIGYREAVAAIAGTSLVRFAKQSGAASAVERAQRFILDAHASGSLVRNDGIVGTYAIWAQTYALRFLTRSLAAGLGDRDAMTRVAKDLIGSIASRQVRGGGWPYVIVSQDPNGEGLATSFLSACVVSALIDARDQSLEVPKDVIAKAEGFLRSVRDDDGSFRYMPDVPAAPPGRRREASGRSPLCALALLRAGSGDLEGVRRALDLYLRDRGEIAAQVRKDLCHTGADGQASYYFLFDAGFAAAAARRLPAADRAPYAKAIRDDLLATRSANGSFLDMPSIGPAYATAMALDVLHELR